MSDQEVAERDSKGKFLTGGNPGGRPKGSRNKITLLKLMGEEAARTRNADMAQEVLDLIYAQAMDGDKASQKLVWQAHMSGSSADDKSTAKEKVEINIGTIPVAPAQPVVETAITIDNDEDSEDEQRIEADEPE